MSVKKSLASSFHHVRRRMASVVFDRHGLTKTPPFAIQAASSEHRCADKTKSPTAPVLNLEHDCAGAILYAAERASEVAADAVQLMGGMGYMNEVPVGRILRDAKFSQHIAHERPFQHGSPTISFVFSDAVQLSLRQGLEDGLSELPDADEDEDEQLPGDGKLDGKHNEDLPDTDGTVDEADNSHEDRWSAAKDGRVFKDVVVVIIGCTFRLSRWGDKGGRALSARPATLGYVGLYRDSFTAFCCSAGSKAQGRGGLAREHDASQVGCGGL
ncbi:hypothetical protein OPT61_g10418 [Boeremia exigua]|uniref:Uncharacterized protein n=1 Tax=Boeremia exigua TaxID=749465 RepID=A0ACC2HPR8_9PLEO|nr:hypothetical protein OPT61_g10418 [Boeremia exigua]